MTRMNHRRNSGAGQGISGCFAGSLVISLICVNP